MQMNEYQAQALETAQYPGRKTFMGKLYVALGINGESGEIAEKLKKILRDHDGKITPTDCEGVKKELGDVLWYVAVCADEWGINLDDVAHTNIEKLRSRKARGVLGGSGDAR